MGVVYRKGAHQHAGCPSEIRRKTRRWNRRTALIYEWLVSRDVIP